MHRTLIALLVLALAGCSEEQPPPKPKQAPEPVIAKAPEKKPEPPAAPKEEPKPPPPPPASAAPKVLLDPSLPEWSQAAPAEFKVKFATSKGDFTVVVQREWAPRGADRFHNLVKNGFFDDTVFFRVISGFMAQFGIHGSPEVSAAWKSATIQDDPATQSNVRGMLSFAMRGPNTRTTQIFINYRDNSRLDSGGFAPFGKVVEGMEVVDALYNGYGEGAPSGRGPVQPRIQAEGNAYLKADFKELDYVKTARIVK